MTRNILIITSDYTGYGHKSITDSLCEQFRNYSDVVIHVIDGFTLGGKMGLRIGKMYGSVTRNAKEIWKMVWEISLKRPSILNEFTEVAIRDKFLKLLKQIKPDLILSVHPNFNGSILNILQEYSLAVPLVTMIADLVSISPLWSDPRASFIICPTEEAKYKCLEYGVPEYKLKVLGFPLRSKFCENIEASAMNSDYRVDRPLECLIMSGGEGVGNMSRIAKILLSNFNCHVKIIAGRNMLLKKKLELTLKEDFNEKVEIYGFMENVQDIMLASDIIFTRGSPNTALEAVSCNVPLVITGALPGQEEGNPEYIQNKNLGVLCLDLKKLKSVVKDLLYNNAQKLNEIKKSQRDYRNPASAKNIVSFIMSIKEDNNVNFNFKARGIRVYALNGLGKTKKIFLRNSAIIQKSIGKSFLIRPRVKIGKPKK